MNRNPSKELVPLCVALALSAPPVLACGGGGTSGGGRVAQDYSSLIDQNAQVADSVSTIASMVASQLSAVPGVDAEVTARNISVKSGSITMTVSVSIRAEDDNCAESASSNCHVSLQQFVLLPFVPGASIADQRALTVALAGTVSRTLIDEVSLSLAGLGAQARTELLATAQNLVDTSVAKVGG